MDHQAIHVVHLQSVQALKKPSPEIFHLRATAEREIQLGGYEDGRPVAVSHSPADGSLGLTVHVVLAGIDVIDTHVQRDSQHIGVAEEPTAETDVGHLKSGPPQRAVLLHSQLLFWCPVIPFGMGWNRCNAPDGNGGTS